SSAAAENATESALRQLQGNRPKVALFFDCVATRIRLGEDFRFEMNSLENALSPAKFAGCNTYGQVARADGQFSGFHNCTAVVCIIPE
ncbi:MAG: FIST C-terminal domain-containing protein, partial [Actinobacteria bacterium]|nr:FIST C-terminal domain-containing protein [Actinomycetota bacterium]